MTVFLTPAGLSLPCHRALFTLATGDILVMMRALSRMDMA
jgi:hypothetical protein